MRKLFVIVTVLVVMLTPAAVVEPNLTNPDTATAHTLTWDKRTSCQAWNHDGHNHSDIMHTSNNSSASCPDDLHFNDTVRGLYANDTINTYAGNDVIYGGEGADNLNAGAGNDLIFGNDGNDKINCGPGFDEVVGGGGVDIYSNCEMTTK